VQLRDCFSIVKTIHDLFIVIYFKLGKLSSSLMVFARCRSYHNESVVLKISCEIGFFF
jgi:hypothetical protein